jgi:hypothetical protein
MVNDDFQTLSVLFSSLGAGAPPEGAGARPPSVPWPRGAARAPRTTNVYRSWKTSVSVLPLPLRRIVPVAPRYAPVPPVIA